MLSRAKHNQRTFGDVLPALRQTFRACFFADLEDTPSSALPSETQVILNWFDLIQTMPRLKLRVESGRATVEEAGLFDQQYRSAYYDYLDMYVTKAEEAWGPRNEWVKDAKATRDLAKSRDPLGAGRQRKADMYRSYYNWLKWAGILHPSAYVESQHFSDMDFEWEEFAAS